MTEPTTGPPPGVDAFLRELAARDMPLTSLLIHRDGGTGYARWWRPYRPELPHMLHSATKSFTGTAVGFALDEGRLGLRDPVLDYFPEHRDAADPAWASATVEDLLTMRTGHAAGISGATARLLSGSWVRSFLAEPVAGPPGEAFIYSSASSHLLSAIVQRAVGAPVDDYLADRLFEPLGFRDWAWDRDPEGVSTGAGGLAVRAQDLLAYGVLHLDGGRGILPAGWVEQATTRHVDRAVAGAWNGSGFAAPDPAGAGDGEPGEGYGYQLWLGPGRSYYAAGMFGQHCAVLPEQGAVIALTGAIGGWRHRGLPELMARHLFPGLGEVVPMARYSGRYDCAANPQGVSALEFAFPAGVCEVAVTDGRGTHRVRCGMGYPVESVTTVSRGRLHHSYQPESSLVAAEADWSAPGVLALDWRFPGSPFSDRVLCRFTGDEVVLERSTRVNSGPTAEDPVRGRRVPGSE
jgi:CubicO group peptidase (beta-lactamase class C family)